MTDRDDPVGDDTVAVRIDDTACVGGGQCELLAAEVFEVGDDGLGRVLAPGLLPRSLALDIVDRCPSGAVSIVDRAAGG